MDFITSTITGGVFGVIIYFLVRNDEEKTASQASVRITSYVVQFFQFARNSIFMRSLFKWEPFYYVSMQLRNRFLYKYGITLIDDAFVLFFISGIAVSILFGSLFESVIGVLCGLFSLFLVPYFLYEHAKHQSALEIAHMMPSIFRTIAVALGSGLTLSQSIEYVSKHTEGVVSESFCIADMQIKCGFPIEEAIEDLAERLDAPGVNLLASALVISHRTGSPLKNLLQKTAELVELQEKNQRLIATKTAQVRLSARIVCLLPVVLLIILSLVSPDFQKGLFTPSGVICTVIAMVMDCIALLIIRSIMRGVMK
ncbi:type II secretion system F family protein [Lancefieldella parvula]|uniref:type II secretion system F family protein n=1 Tax=Lancefieldella parvula TaxID=1382 RepID=UPI0028D68992|nr:type II secretion system F family protein [Lancefieldella parvula]